MISDLKCQIDIRAQRVKAEFSALGHSLLDDMLPLPQPIRLMGLTLSSLEGEAEERPKDTAQLSLL